MKFGDLGTLKIFQIVNSRHQWRMWVSRVDSHHLNATEFSCCGSCFASVSIVRYAQPMIRIFFSNSIPVESVSTVDQMLLNAIRFECSHCIEAFYKTRKKNRQWKQLEKCWNADNWIRYKEVKWHIIQSII